MRAALRDAAPVEHDDLVRVRDRRQAVGDDERRLGPRRRVVAEVAHDLRLRRRVERGRRLVEADHGRVLEHGARERDALLLAPGELEPPLADDRVEAVRQRVEQRRQVRRARRGLDGGVGRARVAVADVLADGRVEERRVLGHDADGVPQVADVVVPDVAAADGHAAAVDVVEAEEEPQERRLAAARRAHDGHGLARFDLEGQAVDDFAGGLVGERHVVEDDRRRRADDPLALVAAPRRHGARLLVQQLEHGVHVHERLVDLAVDHADEIQRDRELEQEAVDEHQVADGRLPAQDGVGREQHDRP